MTQLLSKDEDAEVLHRLGLTEAAAGRWEAAIDRLTRAVELRPESAPFRSNLALAWGMAGDWDRAVVEYRQAVTLRPTHAGSIAKLGRALARTGAMDEAIDWLRRAVSVDPCADNLNALGAALAQEGQLDEAAHHLIGALDVEADHEEARQNLEQLSQAALERGAVKAADLDWMGALAHFKLALRAFAENAEAHYNAGLAYSALKSLAEARQSYQAAIAVREDYPEAWNNLAHVELALGKFERALECARRAAELRPGYVDAHYNLGVILQSLDRPEEAARAYRSVLALDAGHADGLNNLGAMALGCNSFDEATECFDLAIARAPRHIDARWNRSLALLTQGRWREGWQAYEARLEREEYCSRRFDAQRWRGEDLTGRSILIWAEQGLGDTIQFLRFVPEVAALGGRAIVECQPRLEPLLACTGISVVSKGAALPTVDFEVPLLSLPGILGARPEAIPPPGPRPEVPAERLKYWRDALAEKDAFKVGVCWGAQAVNFAGRSRSMPLALLEPLSRLAGVRLISLQHGPQAAERDACPWMEQLPEPQGDILDTASLVASLDVVITVDTMVAHLAGSLGVPVWTLLPFAADWRWMQTSEPDGPASTAWYATMRLFRQKERGDWAGVVRMIELELAGLASSTYV